MPALDVLVVPDVLAKLEENSFNLVIKFSKIVICALVEMENSSVLKKIAVRFAKL